MRQRPPAVAEPPADAVLTRAVPTRNGDSGPWAAPLGAPSLPSRLWFCVRSFPLSSGCVPLACRFRGTPRAGWRIPFAGKRWAAQVCS